MSEDRDVDDEADRLLSALALIRCLPDMLDIHTVRMADDLVTEQQFVREELQGVPRDGTSPNWAAEADICQMVSDICPDRELARAIISRWLSSPRRRAHVEAIRRVAEKARQEIQRGLRQPAPQPAMTRRFR